MKVKIFIFMILLVSFSLLPKSSNACSTVRGYIRPPNYDLVKHTDAIVIGEAVSYQQGKDRDSQFTFKILDRLKGSFTEDVLINEGYNLYKGKSDDNDFSRARPGAYTGACNAYDYQVGKKYVLFLNEYENRWQISGPPFSRINEEVTSLESPWVVTVKHYVRISLIGNYEKEKEQLKKLSEITLKTDNIKEYPKGLVEDVSTYFKKPYPTKSYSDLLALYQSATSEQEKEYVLWALAQAGHDEAKPFFINLLETDQWQKYPYPVCAYIEKKKERKAIEILAKAFLKTSKSYERSPMMRAIIAMAEKSDQSLMNQLLKTMDAEEAGWYGNWFVKNPSEEALRTLKKIAIGKYRTSYQVAFHLASMGDNSVLQWAKQLLKTSKEDRWMAFYIFALSPLPEADQIASSIIQGKNQEELTSLIQGYEDSLNPNRWDRLQDIVNKKDKSQDASYWLKVTLRNMAGEGDTRAEGLLKLVDK